MLVRRVDIRPIFVIYYNEASTIMKEVAITDSGAPTVNLYRQQGHSLTDLTQAPTDSWGTDLDIEEYPAMTFMKFCEEESIDHIELLSIDTNGYDGFIIKTIDFTKISIDKICFRSEPYRIRIENYGRFWERARFYGINSIRRATKILENNDYKIIIEGEYSICQK